MVGNQQDRAAVVDPVGDRCDFSFAERRDAMLLPVRLVDVDGIERIRNDQHSRTLEAGGAEWTRIRRDARAVVLE